jgi:hypothetical protein
MSFSSFSRAGAAHAVSPAFSSQAMSERKAQYAAWRERMMNKGYDHDVIDLDEPAPSPWTVESLFADGWTAGAVDVDADAHGDSAA